MLREETGRGNRVRTAGVKFKSLSHQAGGQRWGTGAGGLVDPSPAGPLREAVLSQFQSKTALAQP